MNYFPHPKSDLNIWALQVWFLNTLFCYWFWRWIKIKITFIWKSSLTYPFPDSQLPSLSGTAFSQDFQQFICINHHNFQCSFWKLFGAHSPCKGLPCWKLSPEGRQKRYHSNHSSYRVRGNVKTRIYSWRNQPDQAHGTGLKRGVKLIPFKGDNFRISFSNMFKVTTSACRSLRKVGEYIRLCPIEITFPTVSTRRLPTP